VTRRNSERRAPRRPMIGAMPSPAVIPLHHVDAFTDTPFHGNPAAVCLLDAPADETWMRQVAAEVNLPETAFVWPLGHQRWGLRWWTPTVEVPLCGHATLATAHVLVEEGQAGADDTMFFVTASGDLTARPRGDAIELDFPAYERRALSDLEERAIQDVVGADMAEVAGYGPKILARLADRATVETLRPDITALGRLPYEGLIVTAEAGGATPGYVLRYFAPAVGIPEDPATGSAQCAAGPFWHQRTGGNEFVAEQVSTRRGRLLVNIGHDGRVAITGRAVTVIRGALSVAPSPETVSVATGFAG
jgi:PhzF family phenazine biosynthesis protein